MRYLKKTYFFLFVFLAFSSLSITAQHNFTVVIDAGHGGKDPGALGAKSKEKDINLAVTLKLGKLIEDNYKDVKVVYTRKTDKYLPLLDRANIANKQHANLFISIHANAAKNKSANGAEVFTFGLSKSQSNLDVAMRENSVILLEDDYKTRYEGFDPSSVESYIMFEFMQDKYIDRSIAFASNIQNNFVNDCKRHDRGVRQAEFFVLHKSACPSVLVELGFISNVSEEQYMTSVKGQNALSQSIYKAFKDYKRDFDKKSGITTTTKNRNVESNSEVRQDSDFQKPIFKVQLFVAKSTLKPNDSSFKGVRDTDYYFESGWYKYTLGNSTDYNEILQIKDNIKSKFPDAFIIAFIGDKKIPVNEALKIKQKR